ncbi:S8 family serine peptidase [Aliikangiella coralliicola]|uniref:S8 family serine peptidase n=1 Tax=Aliikangiella coralliicola TaxID=2592383 RepID=A0A545TW73_9GAMM|nr:S8 family serine peptidase [Aliikangiella coralliicola]TQV81470.1 S8 family serine peptidase [Aliikangiella coralliicola]
MKPLFKTAALTNNNFKQFIANIAFIIGLLHLAFSAHARQSLEAEENKHYFLLEKTYIVQLDASPLASYNGEINGLPATNLQNNSVSKVGLPGKKLDVNSKASQTYIRYLKQQQQDIMSNAAQHLKQDLNIGFTFQHVLNGFTVNITSSQAALLRSLPGIKSVILAPKIKAETDRGPLLINAPAAWDASATGVAAQGEGIVVAVIDSGIRHDHPSFAQVDPTDGYIHVNPLGNGVFLGHCATNAGYCNNKLIGAYNFADGVNDPEDSDGHGTHVASTAVGNRLSFDLGGGNSLDLSGVAPRANLIAYRISGDDGIASGGASVAAINQAVADGVDVINYSFGGSAFNPWSASDSLAYRNARAAGIIAITSAGNDGPNPETVGSPGDAPWITSVAASTHDRGAFPTKTLSNMSGGSTTPPGTISGRSLTASITAPIVYAGNFSNGDTNPEQCLNPFPQGTFSGQIVVCDRGEIARVLKAQHVAAGGAGGFILANIQGGSNFLADDIYVVPGIHINANNGDTLRTWLASGSNHMGTINGTNGAVGVDPSAADITAAFSSRGPNPTANGVITPSVAAPGVSIFAAGIGDVDYAFLQGTSMASPHVAGAAALIKQLKPTWTAGQIHSALMSTAVTSLVKEDGTTPADAFDIGGGRIDIQAAANAGLLMDETINNFTAADPSNGGDPRTLNLPGMTDPECNVSCSWTRTVSAATAGTWNASFVTDTGLTLGVTPDNFTLAQGATQNLSITADINGVDGDWLFGRLVLTPTNNSISTTQFPVAVKVNNSNMPEAFTHSSQRNSGQHTLQNIVTITSPTLEAAGFMVESTPVQKSLAADSDNSSAFDDLTDGVTFELITVAAGSTQLFAQTSNSTAADLDLFIGRDTNGDGQPQESETLASSTSSGADERIQLNKPVAGNYWILVQNWSGAASGNDTFTSISGVIGNSPSQNLTIDAPTSSDGTTPFNLGLNYSALNTNGAQYFGVVALSRGSNIGDIGTGSFVLSRDNNDVSISTSASSVVVGSNLQVTVTVSPSSNEQRQYTTTITLPSGITADATSLTNGATMSGSTISWNTTVSGSNASFQFNLQADASVAGQTVNLSVDHNVDLPNAQLESATTSFSVQAQSSGGGNTGGSSSSGGGGASLWLMLIIAICAGRSKSLRFLRGLR